ncbi:PAS domain-containing protein [Thalassobaculum sp. OXR-137]|uniref:PAS domain-containing protein n=1 Tax=Thalassobaculum sp. OXR-137 TaxID=3100173 RepID=UPI002AC980DA|nr:PAS domain-containing protein [Thalassobaculum sp. OXR-137]WPZ34286.1 PAS domain-containing protein [Thalassobaculum sp. OXR-137]
MAERREERLGSKSSVRVENADRDLSPLAASLLEYWRAARPETGVPDRTAFDPARLVKWLGYLSVYERVAERNDFRNRLEGTYVGNLTGENWTDRWASEVDARFGSTFLPDLREVCELGQPTVHLIKIFQKDYSIAERLLLPVSTVKGGAIDQVFVAIFANGVRPGRKT